MLEMPHPVRRDQFISSSVKPAVKWPLVLALYNSVSLLDSALWALSQKCPSLLLKIASQIP